jgi:predicted RNase H-like HicB family nuclease
VDEDLGGGMITQWLAAGMQRAQYELLFDDDGKPEGYFGKIVECRIVLASGPTLETCRTELQACLEDWLLARLLSSMPVPELDGICLRDRGELPTALSFPEV